jgi:MFS family permease
MARRTNWQWRGDYFAPDLPIPVDLHYILWDESAEHIPGPSEHEFWKRRCQMDIDGRSIPVLCVADTLAFAALHLLMHLLHGDLPLQRAWEIAHFIHSRACEDDFWTSWSQLHPAPLRKLQVVVFALAADWFGCTYPALVAEETKDLPDDVKLWIERYASSPLEGLFRPNKDELWLNLSLLDSSRDKIGTFVRRVFPIRLPPKQDSKSVGDAPEQPEARGLDRRFLVSRVIHHTRTLIPTFAGGVKWWWIRLRFGRDFLVFQLTSALFDFGEYIFYLLFNLYLLERGYNEKFLGQVSSAMTAGTVIGAIPAVALTRGAGLKVALLVALIGAPVTAALRAVVVNETTLLVCAFINGLFMSVWAISFAPAVSGLTNERNRTVAFSLVSSIGIGLGVLAGFVGGRLPGFLMHVTPSLNSLEAKRTALLCGCAMAFSGVIPACWLKFKDPPKTEKRAYPRGKFILGFLAALFVWSVATGAFNPFFNAYLSRDLHMPVERIGLVFSYSQIAQVFVILLAPAVLRWLGQVRGIAFMQVATAAMLGLLGLGFAGTTGAALLYVGYMSFQYMSEPGLFSMLMSRVKPAERSGASALNFLVLSLAGSFSALVSGAAISRFGYSAVLGTAAVLAIIAAALFWILIGEET